MVKKKEEKKEMSLDDAFDDDEDVEYAAPKPKKTKKKSMKDLEDDLDEAEDELEQIENTVNGSDIVESGPVKIKSSKPISKIKKGDKIKVNGLQLEVDTHYILIDHGSTKEMAMELFDPKTEKDYQLRYFDDQLETSIEFFELQEIMYIKRPLSTVEW